MQSKCVTIQVKITISDCTCHIVASYKPALSSSVFPACLSSLLFGHNKRSLDSIFCQRLILQTAHCINKTSKVGYGYPAVSYFWKIHLFPGRDNREIVLPCLVQYFLTNKESQP